MTTLKYATFSSAPDAGFWLKLSQQKLDVYKLDCGEQPLTGFHVMGKTFFVLLSMTDCIGVV